MKRVIALLSVVLLMICLTGCGDGKMTTDKAQNLIVKELQSIMLEVAEENKGQKEAAEKIKESIKDIEKMIVVNKITPDGEATIASFKMMADEQNGTDMEVKIEKGDSGWKVTDMKSPVSGWIPFKPFFKSSLVSVFSEGKKVATTEDLNMVGNAIQAYILDNGTCPEAASMAELEKSLIPTYMKVFSGKDAWEKELFYKYKSDYFQIRSAGEDGIMEEFNVLGDDIVYIDGEFALTQTQLDELLTEWK